MIARLLSFLILLYALGFILFAVALDRPATPDVRTDAIVVLTGGSGRIEHAMDVLSDGSAKRLLISGADPSVTKKDMIERLGGKARLVRCCVDLGSESVDTRTNAEEAGRWLEKHKYKSLRLVLGGHYKLVIDAVRTEPSFAILFSEYNKYLLRRLAVWVDV
jgi:uncharacterized SAM-binding protein YcdF (DUF218 family)